MKKLISLTLSIVMVFSLITAITGISVSAQDAVTMTIDGTSFYDEAYAVLDLVNKERSAQGLSALQMDSVLLDAAMLRAAEGAVYFSHTRPNGETWSTAIEGDWRNTAGENIAAGQSNAAAVMNSWMGSAGHRSNILNVSYKSIGIGVFSQGGIKTWVQIFDGGAPRTLTKTNEQKNSQYAIKVLPSNIQLETSSAKINLSAGALAAHPDIKNVNVDWDYMKVKVNPSSFTYVTSNKNVATAKNGIITAVGGGNATITAYVIGNPNSSVNFNVTVEGAPVIAVTGINVTPSEAEMKVGDTLNLTASVLPSNATEKGIKYTSSNQGVASVKDGKITAIAPGTASITVASVGDPDIKREVKITVKQPVTDIEVSPNMGKIYVGRSLDIQAKILPENASNQKINFTSSNESVAIVANNTVVALAAGTATITVSSAENPEIKKTVSITVEEITTGMVDIKKLFGRSRYDTAVAIADEGWTTSDKVVLASGTQFADALSGSVLAAELDAPILLTAAEALEDNTKAKIASLKPTEIIILGGVGAISQDVENSLSQYKVTRLGGANRYETSAEISQYLVDNMPQAPKTVFITAGHSFADALSISSYAGMNGYPIVYAQLDADLDAKVEEFLKKGFENAVILGGENAVTANIDKQLSAMEISNIERVFGTSRYDTSMAIVNKYASEFGNNISIATGTNFPDALAGSVLAAKNKTPLILTGPTSNPENGVIASAKEYIKKANPEKIYIFGGELVVPTKWITDIVD